ncbi:MAG: ATP-binding protein [Kofleriaceae bacterium]|nr:ATP-binding protein [Kofleriaceae bacterium]
MTDSRPRFDQIVEVLMALARQDFSVRLPISPRRDEVDAVAAAINVLAEELGGAVATRRDLEAAYASLQETQAQLVVAEKFAAIGQLASGVAHELNNPAAWILLGLQHARRRVAEARALGAEHHARLAEILGELEVMLADARAGMERIRVVVGDLRTLSRGDSDEVVELALNDVVRLSLKLARPAYKDTAKIVLELGELPLITGSHARLGQLVTNLILNAAQAIGDSGQNHEIAITTRSDGQHVILSVEDSGPGIPAELRERVFEPYFTTKPADIGTGLGLALVRKIASAHGGLARVGGGTRTGAMIEVLFPIPHREPTPVAEATHAQAALPVLRGRLLIVDDEPMLLRAMADALREEHDVMTAQGGSEALAILAHDHSFDLVLCDLQMPALDGVAVYEAFAKLAPERLDALVFMTGGVVTPRVQKFVERARPRLLDKPIDLDVILNLAATAVRQRGKPSR